MNNGWPISVSTKLYETFVGISPLEVIISFEAENNSSNHLSVGLLYELNDLLCGFDNTKRKWN